MIALVLVPARWPCTCFAFSTTEHGYGPGLPARISTTATRSSASPCRTNCTFCGENVPLEKLDVRERLDRELLVNTYWQSNSVLAHKRAARWFPMIEPVLAREGVPDDMKYLALIESGLTNVVSPQGRHRLLAVHEGDRPSITDLEVNGEVDERYHVVKSTEAACRYLKEAHDAIRLLGAWPPLATTWASAALDKQVGRQNAGDYFDLLLPEETSRYVFRLLAHEGDHPRPRALRLPHPRKKDLYPPYATRTVTVTGPIDDLADFALRQGTDYKTLKLLNPWLRDAQADQPRRPHLRAAAARGGLRRRLWRE